MRNTKMVYGFIGVIGSGKDYTASLIKSHNPHKRIAEFDFSDGVREVTYSHLRIDPPKDYRSWKEEKINGKTGREWLEYIGEGFRNIVPTFWADLCKKRADEKADDADIFIFGSVRNEYEARSVIEFAKENGFVLKFIFTNYKSPFYEIRDNSSERFAQKFLGMGCDNFDDITDKVIEECKDF